MVDSRELYQGRVASTLRGLDDHNPGHYFGPQDIRMYSSHELPNGPRLKILLEDMAESRVIEQATVHINRDKQKVYRSIQPGS